MNRPGSTRSFSYLSKYKTVATLLRNEHGTLLDVGGRDRELERFLYPNSLTYRSADVAGKHDYLIDLERPLALSDREFDFIAALDVLEHLERIHDAFGELLRITRRTAIIALPNLASYRHRWAFLWTGRPATGKYDLLPEHQGDRHRWLTMYAQMNRFVEEVATRRGFRVRHVVEEAEGFRLGAAVAWGLLSCRLPLRALLVGRVIYVLDRCE